MNLEELKRLLAIDPRMVLGKRIDPLGTEYDIILNEIAGFRKIMYVERAIDIPGLTRNLDLILRVTAEFKEKEKRNIMPLQYAKSDDLVVMQLRPEHIAPNFTYERTVSLPAGQYVGTVNLIPPTSGKFVVPEKQIFIITDIIELSATPAVTAVQVIDVDGDSQNPIEAVLAFKVSNVRIFEFPYPIVADSTLDIDLKVESATAGDTVTVYAYPVGVWIGYGRNVPSLTRV